MRRIVRNISATLVEVALKMDREEIRVEATVSANQIYASWINTLEVRILDEYQPCPASIAFFFQGLYQTSINWVINCDTEMPAS